MRLVRDCVVLAAATFCVTLLFGCSDPASQARVQAVERVAYTACLTRKNAPIVATALRDTMEDMIPGMSLARGVVAGSCEVILANPPALVLPTEGP